LAEPQELAGSGRDAKGRFGPGNRANPGGRPKGIDAWRLLLATAAKTGKGDRTYLEAALDAAWQRAAAGSAEHLRILLDRLAPARLALEHSGEVAIGVPLDVLERAQQALDGLIAQHPERVQELLQ
jgi:hypothetical protein